MCHNARALFPPPPLLRLIGASRQCLARSFLHRSSPPTPTPTRSVSATSNSALVVLVGDLFLRQSSRRSGSGCSCCWHASYHEPSFSLLASETILLTLPNTHTVRPPPRAPTRPGHLPTCQTHQIIAGTLLEIVAPTTFNMMTGTFVSVAGSRRRISRWNIVARRSSRVALVHSLTYSTISYWQTRKIKPNKLARCLYEACRYVPRSPRATQLTGSHRLPLAPEYCLQCTSKHQHFDRWSASTSHQYSP